MELRYTLLVAFLLFIGATIGTYYWKGLETSLWFAFGGALSLANLFMAIWAVKFSLGNIKKGSVFTFLLLIKSTLFLAVVAVILIFMKPNILGFTLGLSLIIVGGVLVALFESRRYFRQDRQLTEKQ